MQVLFQELGSLYPPGFYLVQNTTRTFAMKSELIKYRISSGSKMVDECFFVNATGSSIQEAQRMSEDFSCIPRPLAHFRHVVSFARTDDVRILPK